jgi:hypothetical protein
VAFFGNSIYAKIENLMDSLNSKFTRLGRARIQMIKNDGFVKSRKTPFYVIPAKAGIQSFQALLDSRLRGSDDCGDFLRVHQK